MKLLLLLSLALTAFAQLPTQADPDSGAVRPGNIIDAVKFYATDIFLVAGLIIATVIFIVVTTNAISVYKEIRDGRRTWGDLGMHAGAGAGCQVQGEQIRPASGFGTVVADKDVLWHGDVLGGECPIVGRGSAATKRFTDHAPTRSVPERPPCRSGFLHNREWRIRFAVSCHLFHGERT